jgi:hypothetical protein
MNIRKIKVGPFEYEVELKTDYTTTHKKHFGTADHEILKIWVSKDIHPVVEIETLFHEAMHCVDYVYNNNSLEEDQVRELSLGLTALIKDNKTFFKKLLDIL